EDLRASLEERTAEALLSSQWERADTLEGALADQQTATRAVKQGATRNLAGAAAASLEQNEKSVQDGGELNIPSECSNQASRGLRNREILTAVAIFLLLMTSEGNVDSTSYGDSISVAAATAAPVFRHCH
ncbi:unnamed protein product, partial [Scytosiphon promiscuus]